MEPAMGHMRSVAAHIMFARADAPVDSRQGVLFCMYSPNSVGLREHLLGLGVKVSAITYPFYMEQGEMRIDDPDGYCLLIGQAE